MCDTLSRSWGRPCRTCGQHHARHEPHVYDYVVDVDDDLNCHICLQPLVLPLDTPCGHTFCGGCLVAFLSQQQTCPTCRRPLTTQACRRSPLVLLKLLDKLAVKCPNAAAPSGNGGGEGACQLPATNVLTRGDLEDHLRHRCVGNFVACRYAVHGCQVRGPARTVLRHQAECELRTSDEATAPRAAIVPGRVSHVDIPRTSTQLGMTIVGGADTPLRCVVVQEVFADGLMAQDGRVQAGDQIVQVNETDVSAAPHHAVCRALRRQTPVLRLGVYRERVESATAACSSHLPAPAAVKSAGGEHAVVTVTLTKPSGRTLGVKLVSRTSTASAAPSAPPPAGEDAVFVAEVIDGSPAAADSRLRVDDRILFVNGRDVRRNGLQLACQLIQANATVSLVVARGGGGGDAAAAEDTVDVDGQRSNGTAGQVAAAAVTTALHCRTKSAPDRLSLNAAASVSSSAAAAVAATAASSDLADGVVTGGGVGAGGGRASVPLLSQCRTDDARDEVDRDVSLRQRGESMDHLSAPDPPVRPPKLSLPTALSNGSGEHGDNNNNNSGGGGVRRRSALRFDGDALRQQKTVTIAKKARESLGVRVGGGVSCNEGDTPIYIANINRHGPVGRSRQLKKGDIVLSVNGRSLVGLTHASAVAALKATADRAGVTLSVLDGAETSPGAGKFMPSWLYWQSLPMCLCSARSVEVRRTGGGSLGFSVVGGCDGGQREPIHVLFVVRGSPAAVQGRLRCGDRLLAVDGTALDGLRHADAVALLKRALDRVHLQVVSFMGTEV